MDFIFRLFDTNGFPPRWTCGSGWVDDPSLGWIHVVSDIVTWLAYMMIPCVLVYFAYRRKDVVFPRVFWLFCTFIFACGTVHLVEAIIFWFPLYRLAGVMKLTTAVVSAATVVALVRIAPLAMTLPGMVQVNADLRNQMAEKQAIENQLRASNQELQHFTRNVVDREERMLELKLEVNSLLRELGRDSRYTDSGL